MNLEMIENYSATYYFVEYNSHVEDKPRKRYDAMIKLSVPLLYTYCGVNNIDFSGASTIC